MKEASDVAGPLLVLLKTGETLRATIIDGGGCYICEHPVTGEEAIYEVHGTYEDGSFLSIPQDQVAAVVDSATGDQVEFGNPYYPGHPRPQSLDDEQ